MLYCYTLLLSLVFGSFGVFGAFGSFGAFGTFGTFNVFGVLTVVDVCFSVVAKDVVEDTDDDVIISPTGLEFSVVFEGSVYDFL